MPHGMCYLWEPDLLWLHVVSDLVIGFSYFIISFILLYLLYKVNRARQYEEMPLKPLPFPWMWAAFGVFIIACGATHFFAIWTVWNPNYWIHGWIKLITAVVSAATAVALYFAIPKGLEMLREARQAEMAKEAMSRESGKHEETIDELASELMRKKRELQAALTQEEEARQAADAANEARSNFLGVMSHELRTPLNAILGYLDLMLSGITGSPSAKQEEYMEKVRLNGVRLLALIDEVLTFTQLSSNTVRVEPGSLWLHDIVEEIETHGKALSKGKDLEFVTRIEGENVELSVDVHKLRQILSNLVANAVKFTETGEVVLTATGKEEETVFSVRDTGMGIPEEQQKNIFEPFFQVDKGNTRKAEGTGLGLTVAERLTNILGGRMSVQSDVGSGSTFTVVLPRRYEEKGKTSR